MALCLIACFAGCGGTEQKADAKQETATLKASTNEELQSKYTDAHILVLDSVKNADGSYTNTATLDGQAVAEYDYTLHIDPTEDHKEVKNAPAEYYTGTAPSGSDAVYIAHDIAYYPELSESDFEKINYDGDPEYAYYYKIEGYENYIFATLPTLNTGFPSNMMHSEEEAYANSVLHIATAGTYILSGSWHGQILIDLGDSDEIFADESAKVKLILNGADVECSVAPSLIFESVYECDNTWESRDTYDENVDLSDAGAQVIVADGSENNFTGANVYRMLKAKFKSDDDTQKGAAQKKMRKTDGAFYSYMSMAIDGEDEDTGILNVTSTSFEGLDTELHLAINGANVNIFSQDDGINCNEDDVSVVQINGGSLHICAGLGAEGDGIDSNGYLVINDGVVISAANPASDSGLDSDKGSYINGGYVLAMGSTMDWPESESSQVTMNLQFSSSQSSDEAIIVTDTDGNVKFAYDPDSDEITGSRTRSFKGVVISCPNFEVGKTYNVYVGGDVTGTDTSGLYDITSVTGFTGSTQQQYTSSDDFTGGFRPGNMGDFDPSKMGDFNPGEMPGGERPEMPDNMTPGGFTAPDAMSAPTGNSTTQGGFDGGKGGQGGPGGNPPEKPNGDMQQMPEGTTQGGFEGKGGFGGGKGGQGGPGGFGDQSSEASGEASTEFLMSDAVNCFSGVSDVN